MNRRSFNPTKKWNIFDSADYADGYDENYRIDRHGRLIHFYEHGNINSEYGWNIHHIDENPRNNSTENLEPVHYDTHDEI